MSFDRANIARNWREFMCNRRMPQAERMKLKAASICDTLACLVTLGQWF
jgi:hypothetical protein